MITQFNVKCWVNKHTFFFPLCRIQNEPSTCEIASLTSYAKSLEGSRENKDHIGFGDWGNKQVFQNDVSIWLKGAKMQLSYVCPNKPSIDCSTVLSLHFLCQTPVICCFAYIFALQLTRHIVYQFEHHHASQCPTGYPDSVILGVDIQESWHHNSGHCAKWKFGNCW